MIVGFNGLAQAAREDGKTYQANQLRLCADLCEVAAAGKGAVATAGYVMDFQQQHVSQV